MPLSINVGLSRKASKDFQSTGVSINVTAELDQSLLAKPDELQKQIDALYHQAEAALDRQAGVPEPPPQPQHEEPRRAAAPRANGNGRYTGRGNGKALESADQLVLYGVTVAKMSRSLGLPVKLHFGIITKAKTPVVQLLPVPTDADRVAAMKESVAAVWEAIQAGNFYPSPSPQNCTTCPFRSRCPLFGGKG